MRARLRTAIRALREDPALADVPDAVRLAVVVVAARTPESTGEVEIRTAELGRWLGLSQSYVASRVVPAMRRGGDGVPAVAEVETVPGEFGQDECLRFRLRPLWEARAVAGHPLRLRRSEFAVLLRLLEAVMAPGWVHRDGSVTPAGLLGDRTGRGAATDRLALLLLVLEASETGRVRLCGGAVDRRRGRLATTVARLLGCSAAAGERVLERLEERGLVERVRRRTGSGLQWRSRLLVPAVAAAYGRTDDEGDRGREERTEGTGSDSSDPDVAATPGDDAAAEQEAQVGAGPELEEAGSVDPDGGAALHADHSPVDASGGNAEVDLCSSGACAAGGDERCRECAPAREDAPVETPSASRAAGSGSASPLRGEKPNPNSPSKAGCSQPAAGRTGLAPVPPLELRTVLEPVMGLWQRLDRAAARRVVATAVEGELRTILGLLSTEHPADPVQVQAVLADRLTRRLTLQGGPDRVSDPVGWMLSRGLPPRGCGERGCAEGWLLDRARPCPWCEDHIADRRDLRRRAAAAVDKELSETAPAAARHAVYERYLTAFATAVAAREAERQAAARARAEEDQARARRRAALPCRLCGTTRANGLCSDCEPFADTTARDMDRAIAAALRARPGLALHERDQLAADTRTHLQHRMRRAAAVAPVAGSLAASLEASRLAEEYELAERRTEVTGAVEITAPRADESVGCPGHNGTPCGRPGYNGGLCRHCHAAFAATPTEPVQR